MTDTTKKPSQLFLLLQAETPGPPGLGDLGLFLYDLSTLYDLLRLALDPAYDSYRFGKYPLYRGRRPLQTGDQLIVDQVRQEPRLEIVASVVVDEENVGITTEVFRALSAELEEVYGTEIESGRLDAAGPPVDVVLRLEQRGALSHLEAVLRRLHRSPWQVQRGELWIDNASRLRRLEVGIPPFPPVHR